MMGRTLCADNTVTQAACIAIMFLIAGSDPAQLNTVISNLHLTWLLN